ncbi:MAG: methylenetetrahydrofolate reductase C-terminal domain-containing protein [Bacteroidales bacterium]
MSIFTPARRWQPPFYPFKREKLGRRMLAGTERIIKGPLFGCRMCGNCLLQETAFICPMECPKGERNGPCGGSTPGKCYVDNTRNCIWYCIYDRSFRMGREEKLLEVLPPVDWAKAGTETWGDVIRQVRKNGTGTFISSRFSSDRKKRHDEWEKVFRTIRQPEWWKGDSVYHASLPHQPVSKLEEKLKAGEFVFTAEIIPPMHSDAEKLVSNIRLLKDHVTAINFTDNSSAIPRMSGMTCCKIAAENDAEPVFQVTARDNNRTSFQSKVIGANALGINNILCISGDSPLTGLSPASNLNVLDIDSVQMIWILRMMRDERHYLDGREIKNPPKIFIGAAASPFASKPEFQALREQKKVNAGAQFLQTNVVYDKIGLERWLEQLDKRKVLDKVFILVGVTPIKSLKMANHLKYEIPGIVIPDSVISRIEKAGDSAQEEGIQVALELISSVRNMKGINGIHLMTLGAENVVERIIRESGVAR